VLVFAEKDSRHLQESLLVLHVLEELTRIIRELELVRCVQHKILHLYHAAQTPVHVNASRVSPVPTEENRARSVRQAN
jgi:hypothetical protein